MKIIKFASRNVLRNWHRTLVTTLAMAFACMIMVVYGTLVEGMIKGSERNAVILNVADIQIHAKGYRDDPDIYNSIENAEVLLEKIRSLKFHAAARQFGFGLLAAENNSSGVQLRGIDLVYEPQVTELHKHVLSGQWLDKHDTYGVVIGKKLARLLDVSIGGELVFIGQTADGLMANELFKVRGILKSVSASIDNASVLMSTETLAELLHLPDTAHEIVVMRKDRNADLELARKQVADIAEGYETLQWRELMPVIARFLDSSDAQTFIMLLFTYIAVATVILNAILMSVFERIHEFGIMKAIGVTPLQSVILIYIEVLLQTAVASVLGLATGWWAADYFQTHGIDMSNIAGDFSFAGVALDPVWYAYVSVDALLDPVVYLFVIATLAVIYPAIKVAKIRAVDAIHYQ